jgi:hypothetical protein
MNVIILGPAGCGKSSLTGGFGEYLRQQGYSVKSLNLDPGCLSTPYNCDYDIRERFTVEQIMGDEKLGPSGAITRAMDKLSRESIPEFTGDFNLIDTPGQLEVFAFHESGPRIVSQLRDLVGIFILDAEMGVKDLPAVYLYSLATGYRLGIDTVNIINKSDMLNDAELLMMKDYLRDPAFLKKEIRTKGVLADIYLPISELLQKVVLAQRNPCISARTGAGFSELLDALREVKCACGDMT